MPQKDSETADVGCGLFIGVIFIAIIFGCSGLINLIQKANKEATDQRITIEGVVTNVESYKITEEPKKGITIGKAYNPEKTKISFQDGRSKEFNGTYPKPITINKYHIITYNGFNEITEIQEKE